MSKSKNTNVVATLQELNPESQTQNKELTEKVKTVELKIDEEFQQLLPPLPKEERDALEASILKDGCLEPIIIWNGIIINGHNRYRICKKNEVDYKTKELFFDSREDVKVWIINNQMARRNITPYQRGILVLKKEKIVKELAKQRMLAGKKTDPVENLPQGKTREILASEAGISGRTLDKIKIIESKGDKNTKKLANDGTISINEAYEKVNVEKQEKTVQKSTDGKFDKAEDSNELALWKWYPVTGCKHNCKICHARDIAKKLKTDKNSPFHPHGFEPHFYYERLEAPSKTQVPKTNNIVDRNVFTCCMGTCCMGDLFGEWVLNSWIQEILGVIRISSQWNFSFLTMNPSRLANFAWPENTWVGTIVDKQSRVKPAEDAFTEIKASVKFLSIEPLLEKLTFNRLDLFDWVLVGGQINTTDEPAKQPKWEWVDHIYRQAREAKCKIYFKQSLTVVQPKEYPCE